MILTLIDRVGNLNPQLSRELKGRLKRRNVGMAIASSLTVQLLLLGWFFNLLPKETNPYFLKYCTLISSGCLRDDSGSFLVNWAAWWSDIFITLNWVLPFALMVPGACMLVSDIDQEERRGTLNFIRLSPQSGLNILGGKLLGVPALVYLVVALVIPLHLVAAIGAGVPAAFILSFYGFLLAGSCFIYSAALLLGFLDKFQVGLTGMQEVRGLALLAVLLTVMFVPAAMVWNAHTVWTPFTRWILDADPNSGTIQWFYLPISENPFLAHSFTVLNLGIGTYWIWQTLQRCFHSPSATIINKRQSYGLTAHGELLLVGFFLRSEAIHYPTSPDNFYFTSLFATLVVLSVLNTAGFLFLISLLSNQRQALLDWARYRHLQTLENRPTTGKKSALTRFAGMQALIWGEHSPAGMAIAINLLIVAAILLPLILFSVPSSLRFQVLAGMVIVMNLIAIYGAIAQFLLLMKTPQRGAWAFSAVSLGIFTPIGVAYVLSSTGGIPASASWVYLFTPVPWFGLAASMLPVSTVCLAILSQWLFLGVIHRQFNRQLQKAGESSSSLLLRSRG